MRYTFDESGSVCGYSTSTDGTWTYTWKHGRELAAMSDGTSTWTYTYDANGMRTKRTNGTTTYTYVYNGGQLTQMTVGTDVLTFTYDANGNPFTSPKPHVDNYETHISQKHRPVIRQGGIFWLL